jgi:hypothetical protein
MSKFLVSFEAFLDDVEHLIPDPESGSESDPESGSESDPESGSESDPESGSESGSESDPESDPESGEMTFGFICFSDVFDDVPSGIMMNREWQALTIRINGYEFHPSNVQSVGPTRVPESYGAKRVAPGHVSVSWDTHWNCYCKYQDVCGCGCDPLHDGW